MCVYVYQYTHKFIKTKKLVFSIILGNEVFILNKWERKDKSFIKNLFQRNIISIEFGYPRDYT